MDGKTIRERLMVAQAEFSTLPKDKTGYGYKYTDFDTVISTIRPVLAKHKIGFFQAVTTLEGRAALKTTVFSEEDEITSTAFLPEVELSKGNGAQKLGAAITYMRRYCLCAMLGLSSDEDVDAESKVGSPGNPHPALKGGEATKEEAARLKELLSAKYPSGEAVFSAQEMRNYSAMRKDLTAAELIVKVEGFLRNRRPDAPELAV